MAPDIHKIMTFLTFVSQTLLLTLISLRTSYETNSGGGVYADGVNDA